MLFWTLFVPSHSVEAGFLSSLFGTGDQAYAEEEIDTNSSTLPQVGTNSQNITLLQANVSSVSILEKKEDKNKDVVVKDDNTDKVVVDSALSPSVGPRGVSDGTSTDVSYDQIYVYDVHKGDSLSGIASMYDVSVNTILWANDMKKGDALKEGQDLIILPVSGVKHIVTKGQTLKSIAQKYNADIADIADFNDIAVNAPLAVGDELIIPDGEISVDGPSENTSSTSKPKNYYPKTSLKNIAGYFINPVPGYIKTQGIHGKNAVDLAAPIGTPIHAAASGTVLLARMGWNGAYGNMIIIQHPNGTKTLYSHLFKLGTSTGASVSQGEIIGYVGNSGRVRAAKGGNGSHLHFEVYGAKNPGADRSWAN